ncbi:MAG: TolC family protein [Planctomycetota bacterium]
MGRGRRPGAGVWGLLCLGGLALTACSPYWPMSDDLEAAIEAEAGPLTPRIDDDDAVREVAEETIRGEVALPEPIALPEGAGLDKYVELALLRNPRIRARIRDIEALGMRVPQVTSLSDPSLNFGVPVSNNLQTAAGEVSGSVGLSQSIPFPTKLAAMGRVAEQVVKVAFENLRSARLRVAAEVKQAYATYSLSFTSVGVTRELEDLLRSARDTAEARYRAGTTTQQDVLRAEVELYDLANRRITYEQEQRTALARLNILMDRAVASALPEPPVVAPEKTAFTLVELLVKGTEENPELAALREQVAGNLESAALARQQYLPDLSIGGLWTIVSSAGLSPIATGADVVGLNLGVSLPISFHRIRAGILQRNAETLSTAMRWRSRRNELLFQMQDLLVRIDTSYRRAVLLQDGILPRARQSVRVSQADYESGRLEFNSLIENWRRFLDLRLDYHVALSRLESDAAELERLVGGTLPQGDEPEKRDDR